MASDSIVFKVHYGGRFDRSDGCIYVDGKMAMHHDPYDPNCLSFIKVEAVVKEYWYKHGDLENSRKRELEESTPTGRIPRRKCRIICFECKVMGHNKKTCPRLKRRKASRRVPTTASALAAPFCSGPPPSQSIPSTRSTRQTERGPKCVMKLPRNLLQVPVALDILEEADDYHSYCPAFSKVMQQQLSGIKEENASSSNSIQGGPSYRVNGDASRNEEYKITIYHHHSNCNGDCFSLTNAELK
ncbi:hypothetical protein CJ030_MR2G009176 [Morella rubra]|uniref:CCHC-type domain-containing protein n=1 Tax=Morella rubra TaxID=262757 RepID=A0A6A1WE66_9ROSI|nr:hypothetical protein CJ030_MR2G009176 [Morella rubra]